MRKTIIDQIEITRSGIIQIRMIKQSSDGDDLGYHRTSISPGDDAEFVMQGVNAHLKSMGFSPLSDISSIKKIVESEHTLEVIAAFKAQQKAKV